MTTSHDSPLSSTLGVMAHSFKENERRLPIHPEHFDRIEPDVVGRIYLERGYGEHFGISDKKLARSVGGPAVARRADRRVRRHPAGQAGRRATSPNCATDRCSGAGRTACRTRS